ncbi:tetratricopeptide repeat protein [Thiomicrorhabdus indica]|uniref:tetratricopeptide repeat protein n=1 Tax=Thiomicrorhabdus indica TaxID=2267253 RepID=UPI00102D8568|nr:tetratricopeptide repeat protein [Thiomicrorhabdus indica]
MTTLAIWFSVLLVIALALLLWPLLKNNQLQSADNTQGTLTRKHSKVLLGIGLFVPVFTMAMYFTLGTPQFADISKSQIQPEVVTLVDKLELRLQQDPKDLTGWLLLGRSYMVEENLPKAIQAYEKALKLAPKDLRVLLPLADALAIQEKGKLNDQAYQLLQTAYEVDSKNAMTLWLLGMAEKQRNNPQQATDYWLSLYDILPKDHADRTTVLGLLSSVGYIPGMHDFSAISKQETPSKPIKSATSTEAEKQELPAQNMNFNSQATIKHFDEAQFTLEISEAFKQKYPTAIMFLYAKQHSGGMPMPIAAIQHSLQSLPAGKNTLYLTEKDILLPEIELKSFHRLILGYRISSSNKVDQSTVIQKQEQTVNAGEAAKFIIKP